MTNKSPQLEEGHTDIAHTLLEALSLTYMSPYEWQVVMAIFRKTYGWHKKNDKIPNSQIVALTGIHKSHVSRTLKKLISRSIVTQIGNKIGINKHFNQWQVQKLPIQATKYREESKKEVTQAGNKKLPIQATEVTQAGNKKLPKRADSNTTKETTKEKKDTSITKVIEGEKTKDVNFYIGLFKDVNVNYTILYPRKPQREAIEKMLKNPDLGPDKLEWVILNLKKTNPREYYPTITTPIQLLEKLPQLIVALQKERSKNNNGKKKVLDLRGKKDGA